MIATHYGFLDHGRMLCQLSAAELHDRCRTAVAIQVDDAERACAVLEQFCGCKNYRVLQDGMIYCYDQVDHPEQLNRELSENGVAVRSLSNEGKDLEQFFIDLVKGGGENA